MCSSRKELRQQLFPCHNYILYCIQHCIQLPDSQAEQEWLKSQKQKALIMCPPPSNASTFQKLKRPSQQLRTGCHCCSSATVLCLGNRPNKVDKDGGSRSTQGGDLCPWFYQVQDRGRKYVRSHAFLHPLPSPHTLRYTIRGHLCSARYQSRLGTLPGPSRWR
jgi:hypothetical protein